MTSSCSIYRLVAVAYLKFLAIGNMPYLLTTLLLRLEGQLELTSKRYLGRLISVCTIFSRLAETESLVLTRLSLVLSFVRVENYAM